jgi:hypothetical protein
LTRERRSNVNKIDGILATLGVKGYRALRRDRREQIEVRAPAGRRTASWSASCGIGTIEQTGGSPLSQAIKLFSLNSNAPMNG